MRVLVVRLSSLGDVVHTFPALSDLAAARPEVTVDWLVEESFAPLVRLHPAVAGVHTLSLRQMRWPPSRWPGVVRSFAGLRRALRAAGYDRVIDLQGLVKSAVVARLAGAPVHGYDAASAREPAAVRLYRHRYPVGRAMNAVERNRQLLAAAMEYPLPSVPGRFGLRVPPRPEIAGLPQRYGLLVHGASWPTKLWPEANWRALLGSPPLAGRAFVLSWGNAAEKAAAERLALGLPHAFVLPEMFAGDALAGLIGHADLAVGLDSGLMHIACALGVPGVWLYGPTDPGLTGPYGRDQTVIRSTHPEAPCRRRRCALEPGGTCCMRAIGVDEVATEVGRLAA